MTVARSENSYIHKHNYDFHKNYIWITTDESAHSSNAIAGRRRAGGGRRRQKERLTPAPVCGRTSRGIDPIIGWGRARARLADPAAAIIKRIVFERPSARVYCRARKC
ncbi:hypothetical protein EVAR_25123_1 [Eumeta japonica]|uniref:Uncharacterized protein n=1 Tax=Eumeta variegata TaxID=151549 RepID=A0A4C1XLU0_EUMVA|nr:hypothetical protein EVAR_25123_1 [Eumeta japonica]